MPATFTDKKGRTWDCSLDMLAIRRIDKSDFSEVSQLFKANSPSFLQLDKELLAEVYTNTALLFAIVWVVVQPQVEDYYASGKFPVSPREDAPAAEAEFISGIDGAARVAGRDAFLEAISDFFPECKTALSILRNKENQVMTKLAAMVQEAEPVLDELIDAEVRKGLSDLKGRLTRKGLPGETSTILQQ